MFSYVQLCSITATSDSNHAWLLTAMALSFRKISARSRKLCISTCLKLSAYHPMLLRTGEPLMTMSTHWVHTQELIRAALPPRSACVCSWEHWTRAQWTVNGVNGQGARCINMHNWSISTVYPVWDAHQSSLSPRTIMQRRTSSNNTYWILLVLSRKSGNWDEIIPYHSHPFPSILYI